MSICSRQKKKKRNSWKKPNMLAKLLTQLGPNSFSEMGLLSL